MKSSRYGTSTSSSELGFLALDVNKFDDKYSKTIWTDEGGKALDFDERRRPERAWRHFYSAFALVFHSAGHAANFKLPTLCPISLCSQRPSLTVPSSSLTRQPKHTSFIASVIASVIDAQFCAAPTHCKLPRDEYDDSFFFFFLFSSVFFPSRSASAFPDVEREHNSRGLHSSHPPC